MNLPVYDITLDNWDMGIFATSLVENPAIESNFIFMSKEDVVSWFFADTEKREVLGAVLVPDKLIYRKDSNGNEYNVRFTKEIISELNQKMHEEGFNKYFTVAHELDAGGTIKFLESWIKETEEDKSVAFGINEPIGTLFMKVKIESDLIWGNVKEGKLKGFSIELDASMIKTNLQKKSMDFTKLLKNEVVIGEDKLRFNSLAEGDVVMLMAEEGDPSFYEGTFSHEGFEYVVEDGNISTVTELEAEPVVIPEVSVQESINLINQKVDSFIETITGLFASITPKENDTVATAISDLADKFEEIKLELKQQTAKADADKTAEIDSIPYDFDVNAFKAASKWAK